MGYRNVSKESMRPEETLLEVFAFLSFVTTFKSCLMNQRDHFSVLEMDENPPIIGKVLKGAFGLFGLFSSSPFGGEIVWEVLNKIAQTITFSVSDYYTCKKFCSFFALTSPGHTCILKFSVLYPKY